ncbi:MAG TPA: hypothetical protein VNT99_21350 [Methylomirabilota bacterium]|nr:hypothetical protein [Methylomirabilota bacterium]
MKMDTDSKPRWSPQMRVVWPVTSILFLAIGVVTLAFAANIFKEERTVDWRAILGSAAAIGFAAWSVSAMKHSEEWLGSDRQARSLRFWK